MRATTLRPTVLAYQNPGPKHKSRRAIHCPSFTPEKAHSQSVWLALKKIKNGNSKIKNPCSSVVQSSSPIGVDYLRLAVGAFFALTPKISDTAPLVVDCQPGVIAGFAESGCSAMLARVHG